MENKKTNNKLINTKNINDNLVQERLEAFGLLTKAEKIEDRRIFKRFKHKAVFSNINETNMNVNEILERFKKEHSFLHKIKWLAFKTFVFVLLILLIKNGIIDREWFNFINILG